MADPFDLLKYHGTMQNILFYFQTQKWMYVLIKALVVLYFVCTVAFPITKMFPGLDKVKEIDFKNSLMVLCTTIAGVLQPLHYQPQYGYCYFYPKDVDGRYILCAVHCYMYHSYNTGH